MTNRKKRKGVEAVVDNWKMRQRTQTRGSLEWITHYDYCPFCPNKVGYTIEHWRSAAHVACAHTLTPDETKTFQALVAVEQLTEGDAL